MTQITTKFGYSAVFLLCVLHHVNITSATPTPALADEIAEAMAHLKVSTTLTDTANSLEGGVLNIFTGIEDASSYTFFLFFSRASRKNSTKVKVGDKNSLRKAGFSPTKHTKILIHGWIQNGTDNFSSTITGAFLDAEDLNIISVSWAGYSQQLYSVAREAVPYVGAYTASLVDFLVQDVGVDTSTIHVVGFSLGAHIAGVVGENVTSGKLPRITGLDPAGPLFTSTSTKGRLDASDAEFVDVIHTTAGTIGFADPCGTADFYPNGGYLPQPGCPVVKPFQSHFRAFLLYAESLTSHGFIATQCKSLDSYEKGECAANVTAIMGYHINTRSKGVFYLETNPESPYAKGA